LGNGILRKSTHVVLQALSVADSKEAWIFHILPDDSGKSAIWVAQRVPDDHITVVANMFRIREVIKDSPDFMYSDNLWEVAESNGLWSSSQGRIINLGILWLCIDNLMVIVAPLMMEGDLDFLEVYGYRRSHAMYCNRRVWRVFSVSPLSFEQGMHPLRKELMSHI